MARLFLALLLLGQLSACAKEGGEGAHWVPPGAEASLVVPNLDAFRGALQAFLAGVEGASGALELLEAKGGLDLTGHEGLKASGVEPERSLALFVHEQTLGLALGVRDAEAFSERVRRQVSRMGARVEVAPEGVAGLEGTAQGARASEAWSLAWGIGPDRVGFVLLQPRGADAAQRWEALTSAPRDGGKRLEEAIAALGAKSGAHIRVKGAPQLPAGWGLGPAKMVLMPVLSGLIEWEGTWVVEPTRSALTLDAPWSAEGELAAGWFRPVGDAVALSASIPKSQTLTLRARLNPSRVLAIPSFLRKRFLPKRIPGPLGGLLPPTEELLTLLNGDVALTLLGLDAAASVEDALGGLSLARLAQLVHMGVTVGVTNPDAARAAVDAARLHLEQRGWSAVALDAGPWKGVALRNEAQKTVWSILHRGDQVALLSGAGEVARFVQVADGSALSLEASAEGEVAKAAASSPEVAFGLNAGFRRVTRELASKGAPPFFLKLANDIRALSGTVSLKEEGAKVALEVRL